MKVLAAGLCGSDHFVEDGTWSGLQYPLTAGHENVGRIVSVGSAVSNHAGRLNPGTLVGVGWSGGTAGNVPCAERATLRVVKRHNIQDSPSTEGTENTCTPQKQVRTFYKLDIMSECKINFH